MWGEKAKVTIVVGAQVFGDCLEMHGQSQVDSWQQVLVNSQEYPTRLSLILHLGTTSWDCMLKVTFSMHWDITSLAQASTTLSRQIISNIIRKVRLGWNRLPLQVSIYLVFSYVTASQYGRILSKLWKNILLTVGFMDVLNSASKNLSSPCRQVTVKPARITNQHQPKPKESSAA